MRNVGIIAEYNPFHRGHAGQIRYLREQGAQNIIIVLSGCFVQRGAPAWTDKYLRAQMALEQGADFIFELPAVYALSSAEGFAFGGVSLLNALSVDHICFGSECGNISALQQVADILCENKEIDDLLRIKLQEGLSYPAAREFAIKTMHPELLKDIPDLLSNPNNILGIEYLKALKKLNCSITPITITRTDAGYHNTDVNADTKASNHCVSASAIRTHFEKTRSLKDCQALLPERTYQILQAQPQRFPISIDDFSPMIYTLLRTADEANTLAGYGEINEELAHRIHHCLPDFQTISQFIPLLKTKNITYSHISRSFFQSLLGMKKCQFDTSNTPVPYARLLGMNPHKSSYLRSISSIPVITKVADYDQLLRKHYPDETDYRNAENCFRKDLLAADLYRQTLYTRNKYLLPDEYRHGIVFPEDTVK